MSKFFMREESGVLLTGLSKRLTIAVEMEKVTGEIF